MPPPLRLRRKQGARRRPRCPRAAPQLHEPELVRIRADKAARLQELEPFNPLKPLEPLSPRLKRRWKMYVIGAVIFFPLATWFFTPAGFKSLWFQVLVSAAYGSYLAHARPTGTGAVLSTLLAGLTILGFTGHAAPGFGLLMSLVFYGLIGAVIGIGEHSKLLDGR